jgi:hypothetical protein
VIVWEVVVMMIKSVRHGDELAFEINGFNFAREKADPSQELSHGIHDIREIEVAGGNLVQHGSEQKEIVPVHQRDLDIGIAGQGVIEVNSRVQPGKATAENQDSSFLCSATEFLSSATYSSATSQKTLIEPFGFVSLLNSSV